MFRTTVTRFLCSRVQSYNNSYLRNLSPEQHAAVTSDATALNILAGPGSGKTRVLTCRVAHKVIHEQIAPDAICVLTFTKKSANEMKKRLLELLGSETHQRLAIGTFHSVCASYLGKHGWKIGLAEDYTIVDRMQARSILKQVASEMNLRKEPNLAYWLDEISRAKGKDMSPEAYLAKYDFYGSHKKKIAEGFLLYQKILVESNSVDFDDLILLAIRLLKEHPSVVENIEHVLVDEFQDTSNIQFQLLKQLCAAKNSITVVGDPDQSIYGWRAADATILAKLKRHFSTLESIKLEENYRSTKSIVNCALTVLDQDKTRMSKMLKTSNMTGHPVYINSVRNPTDEADFIVREIRRLCLQSNGFFNYNDFSVLVRTYALTRPIEEALSRARIPFRVFAGAQFFDRIEVRDILAYLQFANSGGKDKSSFSRIINVPRRGMGPVQLDRLLWQAEDKNISILDALRDTCEGDAKKTKRGAKLHSFLCLMDQLILEIEHNTEIAELIRIVLTKTDFQEYLKIEYSSDWEGRWDNIEELFDYATKFNQRDFVDGESSEEVSYITRFLPVSSDSGDEPVDGVTISTLHSAKGLEWPCVFIAGVEDGILPHASSINAADIEEERRLLYVGMTRAQCFLYCTHTEERVSFGRFNWPKRSPFLNFVDPTSLAEDIPVLSNQSQQEVARLLCREAKEVDESKFDDRFTKINYLFGRPGYAVQRPTYLAGQGL